MPEIEEASRWIADLGARETPLVRRKARERFVKMGLGALPTLLKCLRHRDEGVRWEAAKILQTLEDPAAAPLLVQALRDEEFGVQWVAASGLISLGRASVIPLLQSLLEYPNSASLRHGAHHVLRELARQGLLEAPLRRLLPALEATDGGLAIIPAADEALAALRKTKKKG